jgi:hypothetical protein
MEKLTKELLFSIIVSLVIGIFLYSYWYAPSTANLLPGYDTGTSDFFIFGFFGIFLIWLPLFGLSTIIFRDNESSGVGAREEEELDWRAKQAWLKRDAERLDAEQKKKERE